MERERKKVNIHSIITFVLALLLIPVWLIAVAEESDALGFISLFGFIGAIIIGKFALSKIKNSNESGSGYAKTAIILSTVFLFLLIVVDIQTSIEESAKENSEIATQQAEEIDLLKNKLSELENRKPTVITKSISDTNLASIVSEWTPRVGLIVCKWNSSNQIASGSFVLNKTDSGSVALTNRHVLLDDLGYAPSTCILGVNGGEYIIPWQPNFYLVNKNGYEDFGYVKTNIPSDIIKVCNEYRFSKPEIGDRIVVLGYPGVGSQESITATEGIISGIESDYYVTSAKIEHGNSGGAAILIKNNCYLGIPTYVTVGSAETFGRILKADFVMLPR